MNQQNVKSQNMQNGGRWVTGVNTNQLADRDKEADLQRVRVLKFKILATVFPILINV